MDGYSRATVVHVVKRVWGPARVDEVMKTLDRYPDGENAPAGRSRVQLAIVKLSAGDRARLSRLVSLAIEDYREVLGPAEYPSGTSPADDLKQYLAWLRSVGADDVKPII